MKNYYLKFMALSFIFISHLSWSACPKFSVPSQNLKVTEKWSSILGLPTSFYIYDENDDYLGKVHKKWLNLRTRFDLKDKNGDLVAFGENELISIGTITNFYDCDGNFIGRLDEEFLKSLLKLRTSYVYFDEQELPIAQSTKLEFIVSRFFLSDYHSGEELLKIKQNYHLLKYNWDIEFFDNSILDPRIVLLIPAFKTHSNYKRKKESESQ